MSFSQSLRWQSSFFVYSGDLGGVPVCCPVDGYLGLRWTLATWEAVGDEEGRTAGTEGVEQREDGEEDEEKRAAGGDGPRRYASETTRHQRS